MATVKSRPSRAKIAWAKVTRQPTGINFMDSGGASGRHWQRPLPKQAIKLWGDVERCELYGSIALHAFLDEHFEINQRLTRWLQKETSKQNRHGYSEYAELLAEKLGFEVLNSDYTYNWENDLSQDFQFSVVGPAGADYLYSDECFFIIETHNGADARGGFSDPVVCKPTYDASWMDVVCGINFTSGVDSKGNEIDHGDLQQLGEKFQVGYTANPSYEFGKELAAIHRIDSGKNEFEVTLKTGERVVGYFYCRGANGGDLT